jgi:hypothetical protein
MDPLTHLLITRKLVGTDRHVILAGLAADLPFYLTYPPWLVVRGEFVKAVRSNIWPAAPYWMQVAHYIFHSLPIVFIASFVARLNTGRWPKWGKAWALHILIDIPTHSRRHWAPKFLWPLSDVTVDGVSWPELLLNLVRRMIR